MGERSPREQSPVSSNKHGTDSSSASFPCHLEVSGEESSLVFLPIKCNNYKQGERISANDTSLLRTLGCINRGVVSKEVILRLVGPIQEYCVQFWCPHFKNNVEILETVQRRAIKMTCGPKKML